MTNNNKVARIKLSIYMIILMLFLNFSHIFQTNQVYAAGLPELGGKSPKQWYDAVKAETGDGSTIKFEEKSQLLVFVNEARAAANTSVFRFTTIGWQVRIEPKDGSTKYMTWIKPYDLPGEQVGNMMYTPFVIPISPSSNQTYSGSIIEALLEDFPNLTQDYFSTMFAKGVNVYFDAIISIKEAGSNETNAIMDSNRNVIPNERAPKNETRGEYYLTKDGKSLGEGYVIKQGRPKTSSWDAKGGIIGGRDWRNPDELFNDYFNKPVFFEIKQVVLQKTVQYSHRSITGEILDPEGKPLIYGVYDIKPGEEISVTVTGMSFPGYKFHSSALNYTGREADNVDVVTGDLAITRTIKLTADREYHYIFFYYEPVDGDINPPPTGDIIFDPHQSADIPGNRDNWVNQNIAVKVTVEPSKEKVVMTSSESRSYEYYDSCYSTRTVCSGEGENRTCWTECVGAWVTDRTSCSYRQTWKATELYVTGEGKTAQGSTVSIGPFIIPNGGTIANKGIGIRGKVMNILLHIYFKF